MFNFFTKKPKDSATIEIWGTLVTEYLDGKSKVDYILVSDWTKIESGLNELKKGTVASLTVQMGDGDSVTVNRNKNGSMSVMYGPRAFLKNAQGSYYQLTEDGSEDISFSLIQDVVNSFFEKGTRKGDLKWKEKTV